MTHQRATSWVLPRLSAMMFLQFFIWGAWYVTIGNFMGAHGMGGQIAWAYTVGPIAAILSPIFLGMVADRFFATERILGVLHILGGLALVAAPALTAERTGSPWPFILILGLHMLCYMPTLGLTNALAFHNLTSQERQFPIVRVWGTIGWIVAGFAVAALAAARIPQTDQLAGDPLNAARNALPDFFYLAGGAGGLLGVFSLFLPHTPPPARGQPFSLRDALCLDALALLKHRSFAVFIVSSFLICIPLAAYYAFAPVFANELGMRDVPARMAWGQISEIFFMLLMPLMFARLGARWMLLVGMLAWVLRYALFAIAAEDAIIWMVFVGILLHGICYDFFFVTGFIYADRRAPLRVRGAAQGFLVLVTQGLGLGLGAQIIGRIVGAYELESGGHDWTMIWLIPCGFAAAVMLCFFALFRDDRPASGGA